MNKEIISIEDQEAVIEVYFEEDGAYVKLNAAINNKGAAYNKVIELLQEKNFKDVELDKLMNLLDASDAQEKTLIATNPIIPEPKLIINVSPDRLTAYLNIIVEKGARSVTKEDIAVALEKAKISYGIVQELVNEPDKIPLGEQVLIAQGQAGSKPKDAELKIYFNTDELGRPKKLEDGRVDYRDLNLFIQVKQDEVLAEKIPAELGVESIDVRGAVSKVANPKDFMLKAGSNVRIENNKVLANCAGQVIYKNNVFSVVQHIEIKSDIGPATGNITVDVNVTIKGSVLTGYFVKTIGDVLVEGGVQGGSVQANNLVVMRGIQGSGDNKIISSGNITTLFVENADIQVSGDLLVYDSVLNSNIKAGGSILIGERGKGIVSGGNIMAGETVAAKVIGNVFATVSNIEVGNNPLLKMEYEELKKQLNIDQVELDKIQKTLKFLQDIDVSSLPKEKRETFFKLTRNQFKLLGEIEKSKSRIIEIEATLNNSKKGSIKVQNMLYPGVKIIVGTTIFKVNEPLTYVTLREQEKEISISPYS